MRACVQGAGDRVFYESLFKEKGSASEMALIWCVEHGVFVGKEVEERYKEYVRIKNAGSKKSAIPASPAK